ncbi:MAG: tetratricopeptide repeat protein [Clostridiales bacterium]|nr:tetratricopeptide repeat protein [Clostridiales bacterium]
MNTNKPILLLLFVLFFTSITITGCSKGSQNYNSGIKAYKNGDYETAADEFSKAISQNPDMGDYYLAYGNVLLILENYGEAINIYNQVITDKDSKIVRENNKKAYYGKGIAYYNTNEFEKAISQFDLALSIDELDNMNLDILLYKADTQIASMLYEEAKATLTLAIDIDSNNPDIYYKRARALQELKEYELARKDLDQAISIKPDYYDYYFAKFHLLKEEGQDERAKDVLDRITSIKINNTDDLYNNARANFYLENYDYAMEAFLKSLEEGILEANYYLAKILEVKEDYEGAVAYYEAFFAIPFEDYEITDYNIATAYNQMGYCLLELGYYERALESFNKGLEIGVSSLNQSLLANKIVALESLSDYSKAYEVLNEYIGLYPEDEEAIRELEFIKTRLPEAS